MITPHPPDCCDFCNNPIQPGCKWINIQPRPSDPTELVNTMAACHECGPKHNFDSPEQIKTICQAVEDGKCTYNGHSILFTTFG